VEYVRYGAVALGALALLALCLIAAHPYRTKAVVPAPNTFTTGTFGGTSLELEIAQSDEAEEKGLGGRSDVPDNYGMLFVFPVDGDYGFWMKDMQVPLDIFWLDDNGHVITLKESIDPGTYPSVFYPTEDVRYVLETRAGYGAAHSIQVGSVLTGLPEDETVLQ
jgi:uncharacterized membrane protein (UPF0127 family)